MTEELEFSSSDKEIEEKVQKPTNCWFDEDSKMKQKKSSTCCGQVQYSWSFFGMSDFKMEITMQNTEKGRKSGDSIFFFWYSLIASFKAPLNTCIKNMESQIIRSLDNQ